MNKKTLALVIASVVSLGTLSGTASDYMSISAYAQEATSNSQITVKSITVAKGMTKKVPVTGNASDFKWSVDNESKISVSNDGVITGLSLGSTTLNAKTSNGKKYSINVNVVRFDIGISEKTIKVGQKTKLIINSADSAKTYDWYASNDNVEVENGMVTGKKSGTSKVGIILEDGKVYSVKIKITERKVETPKISAKSTSYDSITVSWNKQEAAEYYKVYYSDSKSGKYNLVKNGGNIKGTSYVCSELKNQTKYYFKVKAFNNKSESKFSDPVYAVTGRPQYSKDQLQKKINEEQDNINYYKQLQSATAYTLAEAKSNYSSCKKLRDEWLRKLNKAKTQRVYREYNPETGSFEFVADREQIAYCQEYYDYYDDMVKEYEALFKQYDYSSKIKSSSAKIQTYKRMLKSY